MREVFRDFAGGVNTSLRPDELPINCSPRGRNSAFYYAGLGKAVIARRRGAAVVNATAMVGTPAIIGQYFFKHVASGVFTKFHVLIGDGGTINTVATDGTLAVVDPTVVTITDADGPVRMTAANNCVFVVNGTDKYKLVKSGTALVQQAFGIVAPAAPTLGTPGSGLLTGGVYEIALSYRNSATGEESSRGASATTGTLGASSTQPITWAAPTDTQVDKVRVHIRKGTLTPDFYYYAEYAAGAGTATLSFTDATYNALTVVSPTTTENDPPPTSKDLASFNGYLFVCDDTHIYWSHQYHPEGFDSDDKLGVAINDGQKITAIVAVNENVLAIFKDSSLYMVYGNTPTTWQLLRVDPSIGCPAPQSITIAEGVVYFWSQYGPMAWDTNGPPVSIANDSILPTISATAINASRISQIIGITDAARFRVMFALPTTGSTRNDIILPWNYRFKAWESDRWDPIDVASMALAEDSSANVWVFLGGYGGQVWRWWDADVDGVRVSAGGTTFTLSGTLTSASTTSATDSGATFDTGAGTAMLANKYLYVVSTDGTYQERRRIVSNTGTAITITPAFTTTPVAGWTYAIAAADFQWDTRFSDSGDPFRKKHYGKVYAQGLASSNTSVTIELYLNQINDVRTRAWTMVVGAIGAVWDTGIWDSGVFAAETITGWKRRAGKTGKSYLIRIKHLVPNVQLAITKVGMEVNVRGDET